jgi:hypothetical protein
MYGIDVPHVLFNGVVCSSLTAKTFSMMIKSGDWAGHDSIGISVG